MKTDASKLKMSITFDEFESMMIREAAKKVIGKRHLRALADNDEYEVRMGHRRILMLAVMAYCRGALMAKEEIPNRPLIAENLRSESKTECEGRKNCTMPGQFASAAARAWLESRNKELAEKINGMNSDGVEDFVSELETIVAIVRGEKDKIPATAKPLSLNDVALLLEMDADERKETSEDVEDDIRDLRKYLKILNNPAAIESAKTENPKLSPAELRYCEAEGISPADFLKKKSGQ